jgi:hypothetical protein
LNQELGDHILDSIEIIRKSLSLVDEGYAPFYRVIAVQLRLLLCDSTRRHGIIEDISLLPRWLPQIRLDPLDENGQPFSGSAGLTINEWLNQKLVWGSGKNLTIRQLIRQVCDLDGGAHYDPKIKSGLDQNTNYRNFIISLGRYLVHAVDMHIAKEHQ